MLIHSHFPYDQSTSHARVPVGGIHLIASIDSISEAQVTASFFGSTKALHGEVATTTAATTTHNHSNQQYSITAISTSAGAIAERYAYSAYGEPTILDGSGAALGSSSINNRYSYTGREWDETVGLHHFRARWMSPKTGRFLGRDPIGFEGSEWDLYELLGGNPILLLDSTGMFSIDPKESIDLKDCKGKCGPSIQKPEKGTQGWVECDDKGGFVPINGPIEDIANKDCYSKCGADACTKKHEEHHIEQFKDLCPDACKSECGENRKGTIIGIKDECRNKIECYGNKVGLDCLKELYKAHKDAERSRQGTRCLNINPIGGTAEAPCSGFIKRLHNEERSKVLGKYKCDGKAIGGVIK